MPYHYEGNKVIVPETAEVAGVFTIQGRFRDLVQRALNNVEPWERGEDPIHEFNLPFAIGARVVALTSQERPRTFWGINPYHHARDPGLSPYARIANGDMRNVTYEATLELTGTPARPVLTRVYPGDYTPPLPWMRSANQAPGGWDECIEFWHRHAFIYRGIPILRALTEESPDWYRPEDYPIAEAGNL